MVSTILFWGDVTMLRIILPGRRIRTGKGDKDMFERRLGDGVFLDAQARSCRLHPLEQLRQVQVLPDFNSITQYLIPYIHTNTFLAKGDILLSTQNMQYQPPSAPLFFEIESIGVPAFSICS